MTIEAAMIEPQDPINKEPAIDALINQLSLKIITLKEKNVNLQQQLDALNCEKDDMLVLATKWIKINEQRNELMDEIVISMSKLKIGCLKLW